ncbi:DNA adenine methylase [Fusobacterium sp. 27098_8_59]|uniref:DNA adenine methylase n=1 Tax=Fusobacterium sp. 27098_8_59 TaxID=3003691 RepID=UPI00352FC6AA
MKNYSIKAPFPYFGNKGRFYKEIREIFVNNYRDNFVDIFAGAMEIPLSLKNEFKNLNVTANAKDKKIESLLKLDPLALHQKCLEYLNYDKSISSSNLYNNDKNKFKEYDKKFKEIFFEICPCCGLKIKNSKESKNKYFDDIEKKALILLFGFGGSNESLRSSFYSIDKHKKLKDYTEAIKTIEVTTEMFDENNIYNNTFIFLDPPYIQKTVKKDKKFIGYNYVTNKGLDWSVDDDIRIIQFIKNNLNRNNVFLVFGSIGNNLSELLKESFKCEFIEKEYNHSTFGKSTVRSEYFCLIKE